MPERMEFWDELPYNETGKLLRRVVKARLLEPQTNVRAAYPLLYVDDIERSLEFYCDQLGFTLTERWDPDGRLAWCSLTMEGAQIMLQRAEPDDLTALARGKSDVALFFLCEDVDRLHEKFQARGAKVPAPTEAFYGMRQLTLLDPDGRRICFEHPLPQ